MNKINYVVLFLGFALLYTACKPEGKNEEESIVTSDSKTILEKRFEKLLHYPVDPDGFPRSMSLNPEEIHKVTSKDWTSGFFPGNLWQIYRLTGNADFKEKAVQWTALMENQKTNGITHDMGFKLYCSFGEGLKVQDNAQYKDILVTGANTLITRFNEKVGSIKSWDFNQDIWDFPVIVDNMMNLELLFEATKITGDSLYHTIAVQHANTTLKNHVRPDNSIIHVVDYNPDTGEVRNKTTHQGFNAASSWARGQAWGIYGFTMCYRYTKDAVYLKQAEATAKFFMEHSNLPEDGIPYWDFNDPEIPNAPRDASAAAITSSALFELFTVTQNKVYLDFANKVFDQLNSSAYVLNENVSGPFILNHSTGNWPKNDEIDEPIVYGDYYFLEALLRKKEL
jgi:unsaturated chondroitin disaccharide hydrolase